MTDKNTPFEMPRTIRAWKNFHKDSGHWNLDPPKTVKDVEYIRLDDPWVAHNEELLRLFKQAYSLIRFQNSPASDVPKEADTLIPAMRIMLETVTGEKICY